MNRRQFLGAALGSSFAVGLSAGETERKQRVVVIGHTGRGDYGHGLDTMWQRVPGTELVGVADADAKGLAAAQARLKLAEGFTDYRQMLERVKPDIVAIAPRQVDQHLEMVLAAVGAGVRGIYMEKPMCRSILEADQIVARCAEAKVKLALAHRNRYHPVLPVISKMLKEGAIGQLLEIRGRGKEDTRGGALDLWVLGGHIFNLMCYFGGAPEACSAILQQDGRPVVDADWHEGAEGVGLIAGNQAHARFELASGVVGYFDSIQNGSGAKGSFGLHLIGSRGVIDLRIDAEPLAHFLAGNPFHPAEEARRWVPISSGGVGQVEPVEQLKEKVSGHLLGAADLLNAMRENREPLCSGSDGRLTIEMISAVLESQRGGGRRLSFPLTKV